MNDFDENVIDTTDSTPYILVDNFQFLFDGRRIDWRI